MQRSEGPKLEQIRNTLKGGHQISLLLGSITRALLPATRLRRTRSSALCHVEGQPTSHHHQCPEIQAPNSPQICHTFQSCNLLYSDTLSCKVVELFCLKLLHYRRAVYNLTLCTPVCYVFHKIKDQPYSKDEFCFYPYRENNLRQL